MDVVNGKIVSAWTERAWAEQWSECPLETLHDNSDLDARGRDRAEARATLQGCCSDVNSAPWGAGRQASVTSSLSATIAPPSALRDYAELQLQRPAADHRHVGWCGDALHYSLAPRPCTETNFDQVMAMYESQVAQAVASGLAIQCAPSSSGQERSRDTFEWSRLQRKEESEPQSSPKSTLAGTGSDLKRRRSVAESSEDSDQSDCGWSHPLKLLVRKGLSVSDVGELGRIVIPKKDAEAQFQQIGIKGGTLLEMEDYTRSKRWSFRFKWWINNKSRMYVLENTGEFIKYHSLKEHDIFVVYEDSSRKMVVRGHKGTDLDSAFEAAKKSSLLLLPVPEASCKWTCDHFSEGCQHKSNSKRFRNVSRA